MILAERGMMGGNGPVSARDASCQLPLSGVVTLDQDFLVSAGGCWPKCFGVRRKRGSAAPEDGLVNVDIDRVRVILERALERVAENWAKAEASVPQGAELQRIVDEGKLALAACLSEPPAVAGRG